MATDTTQASDGAQAEAPEPVLHILWMNGGLSCDGDSVALRREGLTQEAAARLLGVSVKTVSRWVGGATEPRLRDLRRIQEVFGEIPLQ